jgi:hypothetical protein
MKRRNLLGVLLLMSLLVITCDQLPRPAGPDTPATAVALTMEAQAGLPSAVPPSPTETAPSLPTLLPSTDTPIPDQFAPSPLPAANTGIILKEGECYDLDTGDAPYVLDADCDVLMVPIQILRPQNGAMLCGHATFDPPSLAQCQTAAYDAGDLAPNTDLYICFRSNEGRYGFLVQRHDGAPFAVASTRLVLDWWVYR